MLEIQAADQKESSQDTTKAPISWCERLRSRSDLASHGAIQPGKIARTWSFPISIKRVYQCAFVIPNQQRSFLSYWSLGLTFTSDQTSHSASSRKYKMPLSAGGLSGFKRWSSAQSLRFSKLQVQRFTFPNWLTFLLWIIHWIDNHMKCQYVCGSHWRNLRFSWCIRVHSLLDRLVSCVSVGQEMP